MEQNEEYSKKLIADGGVFGAMQDESIATQYRASLFLLKLYFTALVNLLTLYCTENVRYDSDELNNIYLRLCIAIESMLKLPPLKEIEGEFHRPFETLLTLGGEVDFDLEWEYGEAQKFAQLKAKIDELFIVNGSKTFPLDKEIEVSLNRVYEVMERYRTKVRKGWAQMLEKTGAKLTQAEQGALKDAAGEIKNPKYFTKAEDLLLDKHVVLQQIEDKCFLLLHKEGNGYKDRVSILPQAARIIRAAAGVKHQEKLGLKLDEFIYPRRLATSKTKISDHIRNLNKLCDQQEVKKIFEKFPEDRWGLNRNLDCCKD